MRTDKRSSQKADKKGPARAHKRGVVGYSKKSALLEEAITQMNAGKYGRSSASLKELLALDPHNTEARRLFATLHLKLGSLVTARQAFESLANEAIGRQDYWLAESLLREYLAAGPRCVPFLELLAHVYQAKGDDMAAVGELGKAIEILRDDPDLEHPQKASQLYSKIRELAPASPVAFQLASLFDVQTGEFLVRPSSVASPVSADEAPESLQNAGPSGIAMETVPSEVMPWEQIEEPAADSIDASGSLTNANLPVTHEAQEQGTDPSEEPPPSVPAEPVSLDQDAVSPLEGAAPRVDATVSLLQPAGTAFETPAIPEPAESANPSLIERSTLPPANEPDVRETQNGEETSAPSIPETESLKAVPSPMPWEQVADSSIVIPEPDSPSAQASVSSRDTSTQSLDAEIGGSAPRVPFEPVSTAAGDAGTLPESVEAASTGVSSGLPSPMPWEQVADGAMQIPEAEPSPVPDGILSGELTLAAPDVTPQSAPPLPSSDPIPFQLADQTAAAVSDRSADAEEFRLDIAAPEKESPTESATETSRTSSFSWNSVFDKAWKFAAGTTSPGTPTPSEKPQEESWDLQDVGRNRESEPAPHGSSPIEAAAAPQTSPVPTEEATVSEGLASSPGHPSGQAVEERAVRGEDTFRVASAPAASPAPEPESSFPEPIESGSAVLPAYQAALSPDSEPASPVLPAMPVSFSTVVEEQHIPEAEPSAVEPLEMTEPVEPVHPESSSVALAPEPAPVEPQPVPEELSQTVNVAPTIAEPPPPVSVPPPVGAPSHWNTGEVAVQLHRPTAKKKKWEKQPNEAAEAPPVPAAGFEALSEQLSEAIREWESAPAEATAPPVAEAIAPAVEDTRPDWMQASDAITFGQSPAQVSEAPTPETPATSGSVSFREESEPASSTAASAVDVLFSSGGTDSHVRTHEPAAWSKPRPRLMARLHRVRIGVSSFVGSCFSTTRSLTFLALMIGVTTTVVAVLAIGALGLAWMTMESPPSTLYQNLTITPSRTVTDPKKNGYFLLLGFDAPAGKDPVQAGYERKAGEQDAAAAQACIGGDDAIDGVSSGGASAHVVKGWFRSGDPVGQLKGQGDTVRSLASRESSSLARYQQWLTMPFDDWGYGQLLSPNCGHVLLAHRLFLLEGFGQDSAVGLDRLETDLQAWRAALGQSKTLMMKMLAVAAVQDDVTMASGLLSHAELDGSSLTRLSKMVRPLDQVELSVRWPMQSHFVWATKGVAAELKEDRSNDRPWYVSLVAAMKLPVQRRANAYAEYYEATNKAVAEGRFTNLPKPSGFIRTPATTLVDYLANPVEHIVGIEPPPAWDPYVMRVVETDAQLRLAGLQAWIRRGPQDGDLLTRLAKAGQAYYDPFTGLPMLVNQRKGLLYSVGRDGKDQEGDRAHDVAVAIPSVVSSSSEGKRIASSSSR